MKKRIKSELGILVGSKLSNIGRASNLFWLEFGEALSVIRRGRTQELAEYVLHIQCSWRITKSNKILVASRDFYSPRTGLDGEDEHFEWDVQGNNRFDERTEYFIKSLKEPLTVKSIDSILSLQVMGLRRILTKKYIKQKWSLY